MRGSLMKNGFGSIILIILLLLLLGCNLELKSYQDMTEREKQDMHSILKSDGPSGLSYEQFNSYSEPH